MSIGSTNTNFDATVLNIKYYYHATLFQGQWFYNMHSKKKWGIDLIFQPQYNIVRYKPIDNNSLINKGFEFGLNGGFVFRKNYFDDKMSLYGLVSSGPHFSSGTPSRQVSGFLFSNNFNIGINIKTYKFLYIDIKPGFRHLSNGNINGPNGGINSFTLSFGLFAVY